MADCGEDPVESMTRQADIDHLLEHFSKNTYSAKGDVTGMLALKNCLDLFGKDYAYTVINNSGGKLCGHYPSQIVVLEYEGSTPSNDNRYQPLTDRKKLEELIRQARLARCWTRFVAPVILYKGKHVCRSATLASWQELFGRKGMDMIMSGGGTATATANGRAVNEDIQSSAQANAGRSQVFDQHRGRDIQLLEALDIHYICDLMVETKKVKCGIYITSSEKVDKENRYKDFSVIALPYPGCEFFSKWKDSCYDSENVHYDWAQGLNTAPLDLQSDPILTSMSLDWNMYKDWDLVKLTQNYLLALIHLLDKGSSGLLVHCISGWDRTPLFVSLLRLTLWADGAIHKSLPPSDILYLTLAYDWYLFGHGLPDRIGKGQEIMYFCFKMLQYISGQQFSVSPQSEGQSQPPTNPQCTAPNTCECKHPSSASSKGKEGLRHQGSNVSLLSNTSFGSDGVPFVMDTTQDEDSVPPLGWDVTPSPQRSRHGSGNSSEGQRSRRSSGGGRGPWNVDCTAHRDSPSAFRDVSPAHCRRQRSQSPDTGGGRESHGGTLTATDQPLCASMVSNHYSSSSPVNIAQRRPPAPDHNTPPFTPTPSFGSWVDVGMPQMTPPQMITPPKNPREYGAQSSVNSCCEASDLNAMTTRSRRLYAVAQMFEDAYLRAVLSKPINSSGTLSSLIGNVAEKMGLRSGPRW
ncbi:phosphatidylinositol-3,5-bisphosphate 3-phosphatase MTMR14-like isoform X2 [Babylonia areolata]|uniref:phosphatidylinositol-3,5-bisphosphate 3-phosphatase MTMR14-like isoform X2 n=1 Tax=Babylonia areolata TaxID=304850 RepID=UPI003FD57175